QCAAWLDDDVPVVGLVEPNAAHRGAVIPRRFCRPSELRQGWRVAVQTAEKLRTALVQHVRSRVGADGEIGNVAGRTVVTPEGVDDAWRVVGVLFTSIAAEERCASWLVDLMRADRPAAEPEPLVVVRTDEQIVVAAKPDFARVTAGTSQDARPVRREVRVDVRH